MIDENSINENSIRNHMKSDTKMIYVNEDTKEKFLRLMKDEGYNSQNDFVRVLLDTYKTFIKKKEP